MMHDIVSSIGIENTIDPQTATGDVTGNAVDIRGFRAIAIAVLTGTITDGTHSFTVKESDDGSTWSDVDATELEGALEDVTSSNDGNQKIGYHGTKRYIRVNATVTGATSGGSYAVAVIKGHATEEPVA